MSTPFALPERMTIENANVVAGELRRLIATKSTAKIDLSAVSHCDSAGVAALIEAVSYAKKQQHTLHLYHPQKQLRELSAFLKVDALLFTTTAD